MKKKTTGSKSKVSRKLAAKDFGALIAEVRGLIQSARHTAVTTVNTLQVMTNFEIGRRIVEHEQQGAARAEYGKELLKELSAHLTEEFGSGFSERNLRSFRSFYRTYQERSSQIWQKPSAKLGLRQKSQKASGELTPAAIAQKPSGKSPFTLSWSHYVLLLTIKNPDARSFYEIEAT
jgi:predicted nuclease of restriction endonuclease-like (RecB) superfamily